MAIQANLGLAPNTVEAYGRALQDFLAFSACRVVAAEATTREHIAAFVSDLTSRPNRRGTAVRVLDSGAGLAIATLQQRLTAVQLFYDHLTEEGVRADDPVGRGRYTTGRGFGAGDRGLVRRYHKLPWVPTDEQWRAVLEPARDEPPRNRVMPALQYDAALRREELCALEIGDVDPARRLLRIRAETTKNRQERVVPYSTPTARSSSGQAARDQPPARCQ